jgi:hypothetical protein
VLGQGELAGLEHQDPMRPGGVVEEEVAGQHRAEASASDHDQVERASPGMRLSVGAVARLVEPVADVAAQHITGEVGQLRDGAGGHAGSLRTSLVVRADCRPRTGVMGAR